MSIRIISINSNTSTGASPPLAEHGREDAFSATWAANDAAEVRFGTKERMGDAPEVPSRSQDTEASPPLSERGGEDAFSAARAVNDAAEIRSDGKERTSEASEVRWRKQDTGANPPLSERGGNDASAAAWAINDAAEIRFDTRERTSEVAEVLSRNQSSVEDEGQQIGGELDFGRTQADFGAPDQHLTMTAAPREEVEAPVGQAKTIHPAQPPAIHLSDGGSSVAYYGHQSGKREDLTTLGAGPARAAPDSGPKPQKQLSAEQLSSPLQREGPSGIPTREVAAFPANTTMATLTPRPASAASNNVQGQPGREQSNQSAVELELHQLLTRRTPTGAISESSTLAAMRPSADDAVPNMDGEIFPAAKHGAVKGSQALHSTDASSKTITRAEVPTIDAFSSNPIEAPETQTATSDREIKDDLPRGNSTFSLASASQLSSHADERRNPHGASRASSADIETLGQAPVLQAEITEPLYLADRLISSGNTLNVSLSAGVPQPTAAPAAPVQLAQAIIQATSTRTGETELTLNPEELGTVRFTITQNESALSITVTVDRAETLLLLRRNIDVLAAELTQAGLSGASINFGESGRDRKAPATLPTGRNAKGHEDSLADVPPQIHAVQRQVGAGRLDLRL
ncbi:flagellar hook-length control protein FliK [Paracoccus xiamenensis]|uniref:flagellar hook-length control protein FliK n=1 Tax=Paracoccus xiamenensis TaxID=2714901 RepID=UPI00140B178C|nr:flagellar hook-length control protein FliK [Paracoccus xiamenensis]NHF73154.1 flagellar hook-length control protein FliK [Paracoccus xiamenensis]